MLKVPLYPGNGSLCIQSELFSGRVKHWGSNYIVNDVPSLVDSYALQGKKDDSLTM